MEDLGTQAPSCLAPRVCLALFVSPWCGPSVPQALYYLAPFGGSALLPPASLPFRLLAAPLCAPGPLWLRLCLGFVVCLALSFSVRVSRIP